MTVVDTIMAPSGSCAKLHEYMLRGVAGGGKLHVDDSGMLSIGNRKPTIGYGDIPTVIEECLEFNAPGIGSLNKGRTRPRYWTRAVEGLDYDMKRPRPRDVLSIIRAPMFDQCLTEDMSMLNWRGYMPPSYQLIWEFPYCLIIGCMSVSGVGAPRPPAQGSLTLGITNTRYAKLMSAPSHPQPASST